MCAGGALSLEALRTECQADKENVVLAGHQGAVDALISAALAVQASPSALPVPPTCVSERPVPRTVHTWQ